MKKVAWLLIDDRKGSAGQIRGVGMYLADKGYQIIEKKIEYTAFSALPRPSQVPDSVPAAAVPSRSSAILPVG